MAMIEQVTLRDFKSHASTTLSLHPLTLLVGPNGAGKTSVLQAIHLLGRLHHRSSEQLFQPPAAEGDLVRHADGVDGFVLSAQGTHAGVTRALSLEVSRDIAVAYDEYGNEEEHPSWSSLVRGRRGDDAWSVVYGPSLVAQAWPAQWDDLRRTALMRLDAGQIARPSPAAADAHMRADGAGAATVLANLQLTQPAKVEAITARLREMVPQVKRVGAVPTKMDASVDGFQLVLDFVGGHSVAAPGVSEGTLLLLALLIMLDKRQRPRTLLLDDLDAGLHPTAQGRLVDMLMELTRGPEAIQIVATTHSPYLLDRVSPEAVHVFALRPDGVTAVKCLSEHPEAARYRGALSAGELWTLDDEQTWVVATPFKV